MHPAADHALSLLKALKPQRFEVYLEKKTATSIESKDQKVDSLTRAEDIGLSIRVLEKGRMGFSYTTSLEKAAIEKAVNGAIEIAKHMPIDELQTLASLSHHPQPIGGLVDLEGIRLPIEKKVARAIAFEKEVLSQDPRIKSVRKAALSQTHYQIELADSDGNHLEGESTVFSASVSCKAESGGDSQMGGDYGFSHSYATLDTTPIARFAAQTATEILNASDRAPTQIMPAILRNSVVSELIDFLSSSFSTENIDKGRSLLMGKLGEKVFSDKIDLIDDGRLSGGLATFAFDGEGTATQENRLIQAGTVKTLLADHYYAKKMNLPVTGSASRGIKAPPHISTTNLYLKKGSKNERQLIDSIGNGILITDLMGLHMANPVTGDFSLGASGILIENGQLSQPVRGFAVAGNILTLLNRVVEVGGDLRFFGSTGAPSIWVSELSVGGS